MSFTDKKRQEIKKYILRKISLNDKEFISKTIDNFDISITSVKRYLQEFITKGQIVSSKDTKCGYLLTEEKYSQTILLTEDCLDEGEIFDTYIVGELKKCNTSAIKIWQYVCAEMLNNAIEHSRGKKLYIEIRINALYSTVIITDDGVGTFRTLMEYMSANGWKDPKEEDAIVELYKGKITSNASCHSGEGIFFSSKMVDEFILWSDARMYKGGNHLAQEIIKSHLLSYVSHIQKIGTLVWLQLENETNRNIAEVFNMYTDEEQGFIKTHIPVKSACIHGEPVARSQARRICGRLNSFKEVILDFTDVEFMGQGFSDEIFRVYATAHPEVILKPINAVADVRRMIKHVGRGNLPKNVDLSEV